MLGFLIGIVCLVALFKLWRGSMGLGPWGRRWGGCGHGGIRSAGFRRFWMRGLFSRLDTTPGQEKVFVEAVDDLRERIRSAREEVETSRKDVAAALRSEPFDQARVKEAFARHETLMRDLQKSILGSLAKIHEALEDKQRRELADLIESAGFTGHPRWSWA